MQGAELFGAGVRELGEVRRGPERRRGQDVRRVAQVQVGQRGRQVAQRQRGADAVRVPLLVPAQPVMGVQQEMIVVIKCHRPHFDRLYASVISELKEKNQSCTKSCYWVSGGSLSSPAAISISCQSRSAWGEAGPRRTHLDSNAALNERDERQGFFFLLTRSTPQCTCSRSTVGDPRSGWS